MYRHLFRCTLVGLLSGFALTTQVFAQQMEIHHLATDFAVFWDNTQNLPQDQRVAEFKKQIGSRFPDFYEIQPNNSVRTQAEQDELIAQAITYFPKIRVAYLAKAEQFDVALPKYVASFKQTFPEYHPTVPIYFLHSLSQMDGGTRTLNGHDYLIFGADMMTRIHGDIDEAAFFHHELFHTYNDAVAPQCENQGAWQRLWREGLAVYVSKVMNPNADDKELLLDLPDGTVAATRANLAVLFAQLDASLDSTDPAINQSLFQMGSDSSGLPRRRGYYLGYLVAGEIGKTHSLNEMAKLDCAHARELVVATVGKLRRESAATTAQK
jgi:hypothetical protein